jgi:hypothetical protein
MKWFKKGSLRMINKRVLALTISLVVCALSACVAGKPVARIDAPRNMQASRIRVIGQKGVAIEFLKNSECYDSKSKWEWALGNKFSFTGNRPSTSIGMPETSNVGHVIKEIAVKRPFFYIRDYFNEYEVEAEKPLIVFANYYTVGSTGIAIITTFCRPLFKTFIPKSGKDYEAYFDVKNGLCMFQIKEIETTNDTVTLKNIDDLKPAQKCSQKPVSDETTQNVK